MLTSSTARVLPWALLVVASLVTAAAIDNDVPSQITATALYATPLLIAAQRWPPWAVAATGAVAIVGDVIRPAGQPDFLQLWAVHMPGLVVLTYLSVLLSAQRRQETQARERAERTASRLAQLHTVTEALARALTPAEVYQVVLDKGAAALGAQSASVALVGEGGKLKMLHATGAQPSAGDERQCLPDGTGHPLCDAIRLRQPLWLESPEDLRARYPDLRTACNCEDAGAWAIVPLVVRDHAVGALGLGFGTPRGFDADERHFIQALAQMCTQALERARLYGEERRARRDAEAALQARDEFLTVAAHELKTPLTSLRLSAQLTVRRLGKGEDMDPAQVRQALQVIDRQSERVSRLVAQLFDLAQLETGELVLRRRVVELKSVIERLAVAAQAQASRHTVAVRGPCVPALVDPQRLEQVVSYLLDNAIRYSPDGGPVEIEVAEPSSGSVQVAVTDRGMGIAPEHRRRIFDRFYQAHTDGYFSGLGLGLYISRQLVELHGGRLWAEFPPEGGTRFVLALPAGPVETVVRPAQGSTKVGGDLRPSPDVDGAVPCYAGDRTH